MNWVLIAIVFGAVSPAAYAQSGYDRDTESKVIALEQLLRVQALPSNDLNALNTFLADELVMVTSDGRLQGKSEFLASLHAVHTLRYVIRDLIVRVHGNTSMASGIFQTTGVERGKAFMRQGRFLDTWVNNNGRWMMVASVAIVSSDDNR